MGYSGEFTHLHVHTEYSLLDGSAKIKELVARAKEMEMSSLAITDHGVMFGVIDFYKAAKDAGIKPIIGCEVYVSPKSRFDKEGGSSNKYNHLVLLAENMDGYRNLVKLVSFGFTEGFYYKPRIDMELLEQYSEGLIALSACPSGLVASCILRRSYDAAKAAALEYNRVFGQGNFYLELQNHGMEDQKKINEALLRLHSETGIPLVATNDSHYIYKEDATAHDILLCIQTASTVDDENRMRYESSEFYLKSQEEMYEIFSYAPQALENTNIIAERCNVEFKFHELKLPRFDVGEHTDALTYLTQICNDGLIERYGENALNDTEKTSRLNYELDVIRSMGYVDYFLIVWDFIKYARDNDIPVGPGRGSAAGSIVSYCLKITDIDPLEFNLMFERFLNPERISMPDIDIDFCYERRQEVIDYCIDKYGVDHVTQIITFGTMAARAVIRDVGRALAMPYAEVDKVAKMIPFEIGISISKALEINSELSGLYKSDDRINYLLTMSMRLEGLPRHASTHAAGVVICEKPVVEYVPLNSNDGTITTQFPMNTLEELGLLKMDFLGLRTLTVIKNAINEIKSNSGTVVDFSKVDMNDKRVYELISAGKTEGIFQLESAGMTQFMRELAPERIDDVIAGIALYRPGPMDFIPKYIMGRHSGGKIQYTHPSLEHILSDTYGCIVYQEQVMQIVRDLAGYSLARSDLVRRAMSKKKVSVMEEERHNFVYGIGDEVPGCIKNGIPAEAAEKIFDEMTDFAKYAFNKSHAASYAVLGFQTAWLKIYYPVEFMAALLTSVMYATGKITEYIEACKRMGITVLKPDVNESQSHFSVHDGKIRFGLLAIKNVGYPSIAAIVKARKSGGRFISMAEFINRVDSRDLNKRTIESLIKAGAFDSLGGKRVQYMTIYKQLLDGAGQTKKRNLEGQINLFELGGVDEQEPLSDTLPIVPEYAKSFILAMEKEVMGIYLSGHPMDGYHESLSPYVNVKSTDFHSKEEQVEEHVAELDNREVAIGGIISEKTIKYTKNNQPMAYVKIEDLYGAVEVIIFPKVYEQYFEWLVSDTVILVEGRASVSEDDDGKIIAKEITPYEHLQKRTQTKPAPKREILFLKIDKTQKPNCRDGLSFILEVYKGNTPVYLVDEYANEKHMLPQNLWVTPTGELLADLKGLLGDECVVLKEKK